MWFRMNLWTLHKFKVIIKIFNKNKKIQVRKNFLELLVIHLNYLKIEEKIFMLIKIIENNQIEDWCS